MITSYYRLILGMECGSTFSREQRSTRRCLFVLPSEKPKRMYENSLDKVKSKCCVERLKSILNRKNKIGKVPIIRIIRYTYLKSINCISYTF